MFSALSLHQKRDKCNSILQSNVTPGVTVLMKRQTFNELLVNCALLEVKRQKYLFDTAINFSIKFCFSSYTLQRLSFETNLKAKKRVSLRHRMVLTTWTNT